LDDVTMPLRASPKALVRCPLCLEEYTLSEALGGLPPTLVVLDGSELEDEPALVGGGVVQAEYGGGDEYRLSGGGFGAALDASGPGAGVAAPRPVVKGARAKRKEKNAFVELVKIVLGGLVGLTLGYFALLWGLGMDVLNLGPKITPYAPWIVPARFHDQQVENSTASTNGAASQDTSGDSTPRANGLGQIEKEQANASAESVEIVASAADPTLVPDKSWGRSGGLGGVAEEPDLKPIPLPEPDLGPLLPEVNPKPIAKPGEPIAEPEPTEKPEPTTKPETTKPEPKPIEKPEPAPPEANPQPKPEPKPEPAPDTKALPTAEDLTKAVVAAAEGYTKVNEATGQPAEVRRQLFTELYNSASEAGRIITQFDPASPELAEQIETLKTALAGLATQPGKVSALKSLTDIHLPQRKHNEGVLLAGVVQDFAAAGSLFACKFQAGKSLTETMIVSVTNPEDAYKAGDELLVVGRVVDDPKKNLPGYEGDAERVVLLGYGAAVPKAEPTPNP